MNSSFSCNLLLDPTSHLYRRLGRLFVRQLESEFNGTEHVYNCDSFNEMSPPSAESGYLRAAGAATLQAMTDTDPDAVWLMQGWLFLSDFWTQERAKAYVTSVPTGRMIVLDLASEHQPIYNRMESYFGQPFVWCMLHNFGGQHGMRGPVQSVVQGPFAGRAFPNSTMVGTGLTMEGIFQNYVVYDLMLEMGWRAESPQLLQWASDYAARRYGAVTNPDLLAHAWQLLIRSVYNGTSGRPDGSERQLTFTGPYIFTNRPSMRTQPQRWFQLQELVAAWSAVVEGGAPADLAGSATLRHDAADVTREALSQLVAEYHRRMLDAYRRADHLMVQELGALIMECYDDLDHMLATTDNFLLGHWLHEAISSADNDEDAVQFEYNARNQVTLWGPAGEIVDYAAKQWAGLLRDYYRPRWRLFTDYLVECLLHNSTYSQSEVNQRYLELAERPFTLDNATYPHTPTGDTYIAVRAVYEKYKPALQYIAGRPSKAALSTLLRFQPLSDTGAPDGHLWRLLV